MKPSPSSLLLTSVAVALALLALVVLERARSGIDIREMRVGETPATLYTSEAVEATDALVVISHGFAGSRQMMEAISLTLARSGHAVLAFDYLGHGRNPGRLSPEIHSLEGTTEDLVLQTLEVVDRARQFSGRSRLAFVGHSMATDIVIRAAARLDDVDGIVAISMYSEAVTAERPSRLLIISGTFEGRLRQVARETVALVDTAQEGETAQREGVLRRAVVAPLVGHVGVLWSSTTLTETASWLGGPVEPARTGLWVAVLLVAIVVTFRYVAHLLPRQPIATRTSLRRAWFAAVLPVPLVALSGFADMPLLGLSGFGALAIGLGAWGGVALLILRPTIVPHRADALSGILLVGWGLGVFALALDRYGAAFLPTGPRLPLMALLLPSSVLFALADRVLVHGRGVISRILLRVPFLASLLLAMSLSPENLGLLFTVAPVLVLFLLVYGTMAGWVARRVGPVGPGIASGVILAWSIAASTPLFAA